MLHILTEEMLPFNGSKISVIRSNKTKMVLIDAVSLIDDEELISNITLTSLLDFSLFPFLIPKPHYLSARYAEADKLIQELRAIDSSDNREQRMHKQDIYEFIGQTEVEWLFGRKTIAIGKNT